MDIINSTTVVVYTAAELKTVIEATNTYTMFYLGADITLTAGIDMSKKTNVTIDGFYPLDGTGVTHTLTDMASTAYQNCIGVLSTSSVYAVMQNINLYGRNYYGIMCAYNSSITKNVIFEFRNVTYTGPQMVYHGYGLTRFIDCTINIQYTSTSSVQEFIEANCVEIGGKTTITHTSTDNAVFWFRNGNCSFTILSGADVTINTVNYIFYIDSPIAFTVSQNAKLNVITKYCLCYASGHNLSSVLVDTGATFSVMQSTKYGSNSTLNCSGNFTVNSGATVYMAASYSSATPLVNFSASGASFALNNPESFVLCSNAPVFSFTYTTAFSINGGALRYWLSGTLQDKPLYTWKKSDETNISLTGSAAKALTTISVNNFTPDELLNLPDILLLKMHTATILCLVAYPGQIYLQYAPDTIEFDTTAPISTNPLLLGRSDENVKLSVYDSRINSSGWNLYAAIDGPMMTVDGKHQLTDALVFVNNHDIITLSDTSTLVYSGTDNDGSVKVTDIDWDVDKGILLRLGNEPLFNGEKYSAKIAWTLEALDS